MPGRSREGTAAKRTREPRFSRQNPDVRRQQIVEAAIRCLAKGGVGAFTVSEICAEAGISHGLINHYFPSKEDLLITTYHAVADQLGQATRQALGRMAREPEDKLTAIVETSFSPHIFNETNLAVWLALWGQVRNHPGLRATHNEIYAGYRRAIARQIEALAAKRGLRVDAPALALSIAALIDGLWLEWCLDPTVFEPAAAKATCYRLLEDRLGPLAREEKTQARTAEA